MAHATLPIARRPFGRTMRQDRWWIQPLVVFVVLSSFLVYATWTAFQNAHYPFGPYLSPFYRLTPATANSGSRGYTRTSPRRTPGSMVEPCEDSTQRRDRAITVTGRSRAAERHSLSRL